MSEAKDRAPAFGEADLTNCDREPIHVPGSIQPHGVLLALDPRTGAVAQAAGDLEALLGIAPAALVGARLDAVLDGPGADRVAAVLAEARPSRPVILRGVCGRAAGPLALAVHIADGVPIVEIEPGRAAEGEDPLALVQGVLARLQDAPDVASFLAALAREVRRLTGHARAMIYRFAEDDSGAVVAEERRPDLEPYLGLRYPASDIPRQARAMYLRSWLRLIPDAAYVPAPIVPAANPATGRPLDLTFALLRSVSPLHLRYMANMGVRASMSLSLVVEGRLWGLVACHHDAPLHLSHPMRACCDLLAQTASLQLAERLARAEASERLRAGAVHARLVDGLSREGDIAAVLTRRAPGMLDLLPACGGAVHVGGVTSRIGDAPDDAEIAGLIAWLGEAMPDGVFATDRLPALYPPAADFSAKASGIVALSVSRSPRDYVIWFRPEVVTTVTWAGDPTKPVAIEGDTRRLTPRASFAAWRAIERGKARPWSADEIAVAEALRASILEVVLRRTDEIAREREAARARQDVLIAELDHRVKNILATIQSLVKYSAAGAQNLDAFTQTVQMRLHAMARTHDLLTSARWEGASLSRLIEAEASPYGGRERVAMTGPHATLAPKAALPLSLALHELTTNAAKYGALSVPGGRVAVSWDIVPEIDRLVLVWRESGGPVVVSPARRGFGRTLLERSLAFELGGEVALDFAPDGFVCRAEIPLDRLVGPLAHPLAAGPSSAPPRRGPSLAGMRVLVVEDQALIAMEAQDTLEAEGAVVAGPFGRLATALEAAQAEALDAALVDVDLDGERSWPVADALARRGVPFAFTTGFQAAIVFPERFLGARVLSKPYPDGALVALVRDLVPHHRSDGAGSLGEIA